MLTSAMDGLHTYSFNNRLLSSCFSQVLVNTRRWCGQEIRMLTLAMAMVSIPTVLIIDFYFLVSVRF